MRDGVEATLADLETGERVPARELLSARIERSPRSPSGSAAPRVEHTRALVARQRRDPRPRGRGCGVHGVAAWLADRYLGRHPAPAASW